jgi:hypothetical protein
MLTNITGRGLSCSEGCKPFVGGVHHARDCEWFDAWNTGRLPEAESRVLSAVRSVICDMPDCDESWCQERAQEFLDGLAAQGYEIAPARGPS